MFIDANVFIYANFDNGKKGTWARSVLHSVIQGKKAITSSLVLDEIMWVLVRNKLAAEMRDVIAGIYALPHVDIVPISSHAPLRSLDFMETHNMKPRDALHVATMEEHNMKEIASDDKDFDRIPSIKRIKPGK